MGPAMISKRLVRYHNRCSDLGEDFKRMTNERNQSRNEYLTKGGGGEERATGAGSGLGSLPLLKLQKKKLNTDGGDLWYDSRHVRDPTIKCRIGGGEQSSTHRSHFVLVVKIRALWTIHRFCLLFILLARLLHHNVTLRF